MTYDELKKEWLSATPIIKACTSGSTGKPTEIMLPKDMVFRSAQRTIDFFHLLESSHLHSCIAPDFIGGKMMLIRALICNARFSFETPSNRPLQGFDKTDTIDLVSVVPSQMRYIIDNYERMPRVKCFLIGGSAIPRDISDDIVRLGINAYESYGMTETASHIALRKVDGDDSPFSPLSDVKIGSDNRGCLVIDLGPDGKITTNDIIHIFPDGRFKIMGRADHVIVTGGKKVNPAEVEAKIQSLFNGCDICITSKPDDLWTNRIVLLVETPKLPYSEEVLKQKMKNILEPHCVPKVIIAVSELPRTASGKIIRKPLQ